MRKIKFLSMLVFAAFVAVSFYACKGDDDGDDDVVSYLIEDEDGWKYTLSYSELKDSGSELSFTETSKYILPEDATVTIVYTFQYDTQADSAATSKDNSPITSSVWTVTSSSAAIADSIYDSSKDDESYVIERDGNKIICTYKKDSLEGWNYLSVKAFYEDMVKWAEASAINETSPNNQKGSANNGGKSDSKTTSTKININFAKDTSATIVEKNKITYINVDSKSGVATIGTYTFDDAGGVTGGKIDYEFVSEDKAKNYATYLKNNSKDENGARLYKSISIDGNKVIAVYSDAAVAGMNKNDLESQFKTSGNTNTGNDASGENDSSEGGSAEQ